MKIKSWFARILPFDPSLGAAYYVSMYVTKQFGGWDTQELMRHSSPVMTIGTYAQAVTSDKRVAQSNVAALFVVNSAGKKKTKAALRPIGPLWTHAFLIGPKS
jgi:hypothetical protein